MAVCEHCAIEVAQEIRAREVTDGRLAALLDDAADFFESYLWQSPAADTAREVLRREGLDEKVLRDFGVGYAPVGPQELLEHLQELGYSTDEVVESGLARVSGRGRIHAHFYSRIMFPIRNRDGGTIGFAGLGTHLGPSWPLWLVSPDAGLYRRSEAIFALDLAAQRIAANKTAVVVGDCLEVLRAHKAGESNVVTVHTGGVTLEQIDQMADGIPGGVEALELDLRGIALEPEFDPVAAAREGRPTPEIHREPPPHAAAKRLALVTATALVAINTWTGAPLLAVWVGSHAQSGKVLSLRGVVTVFVVLAVLEFLLGLALTWLSATYDRITGRPRFATQTSPWHRAKRGDRVQDIRSRFGMSAPEKVVAASVIVGVLAFEFWFFFIAGSPFGT
jgi:DNA primase catalytic core, N-terminal domain